MNWDRIEEEWITMTRRIRADWRDGPAGITERRIPRDALPSLPGPPADAGLPEKGPAHGNLPIAR